MLKHFIDIFIKICNYNVSESHSNTLVHQFEAMNSFSRYLVIPQYLYFKYHGMIDILHTPTTV